MPSINEVTGQQSQLEAGLDAAVENLSVRQNVRFQLYQRVALAPDSSVFWVATLEWVEISGSLHIAVERYQDEDQTIGANQVLFTAEDPITAFNAITPGSMWIGDWPMSDDAAGPTLKVAFARRGNFFGPANLWHYAGFTVYPALLTQLVASEADLPTGPIVSNSLPIWLSQTSTFAGLTFPVYPSFLVPENAPPPYVVAHIEPSKTRNWGNFPVYPWPGTVIPNSGSAPLHALGVQVLARDDVTLTLYGFTDLQAWQYLAALIDYSTSAVPGPFGFANAPVPQDDKRTQREITTIAQKKTIFIEANYYQTTADAIARRLILQAGVASITVNTNPV